MKKFMLGFVAMLALISMNTAHASDGTGDSTSTVASSGGSCPFTNGSSVDRDADTAVDQAGTPVVAPVGSGVSH